MLCPRCCGAAARAECRPIVWRGNSRYPFARSSETSMRWKTAERFSGRAQARVVGTDWRLARPCRRSACLQRRPWRSWQRCPLLPTPRMPIWRQPESGRSWTSSIPELEHKPTNWQTASGSTRSPPLRVQSGRHWRSRWSSSGWSAFATFRKTTPRAPATSSPSCSPPRTAAGTSSGGVDCAMQCDGSPWRASSVPTSQSQPVVATPLTRLESPRRTPDRCTAAARESANRSRERLFAASLSHKRLFAASLSHKRSNFSPKRNHL